MAMDNTIRELAFTRAPLAELRKAARAAGMRALLEDGRTKIRNGVTTIDELVRTTQVSDLMLE